MKAIHLLTGLAAITLLAGSASAAIFADSIETPVVTGLDTGASPTNWLQSDQGYGASNQGIANEDTLDFTTPFGDQALQASFATNSGWTTSALAITGAGGMIEGVLYELSLNVAVNTADVDSGNAPFGVDFSVALLSFDPTQTVRDDVRGSMTNNNATLLGSAFSGAANVDDMSQTVSFSYTALTADVGRDLAIRVRAKESTPVYFDNFTVVPEPSAALLGALGFLALLRRRR